MFRPAYATVRKYDPILEVVTLTSSDRILHGLPDSIAIIGMHSGKNVFQLDLRGPRQSQESTARFRAPEFIFVGIPLPQSKIGRVHHVKRAGNVGEVRHDGRLLGIKAPAVVLAFTLTPYSRLEFRGIKMPWPVRGFDGLFTCEETPEGTVVVHRECFIFGRTTGHLFRLVLGWWLKRDTPAEVLRMKALLESTKG